ncbi:MAG: radical SAM protein [Candidatus Alcyoniella australis]|nr:radical SAM protein [Candidatus Alcyoniella australis]
MTKGSRVLLVNPFGKRIIGDRTPPYHLISLATALPRDLHVEICDLRFEDRPLQSYLGPDLAWVGITCMIGKQLEHAAQITAQVHEQSDAAVVWGGVLPTQLPELALEQGGADYLIRGEGEIALRELIAGNDRGVQGLLRRGDPVPPPNERRLAEQIDLAQIEDLRLDLVDMRNYIENGGYGPAITLLTSRGCPNSCAYCYQSTVYQRSWRAYSVDWVVRMILMFEREYGIKHFQLMDDNIMVDIRRVLAICQRLIEQDNDRTFSIFGADVATTHKLGPDDLKLLARAGCKVINIGVESGSERIQELIDKRVDFGKLFEINQTLRNAGIKPTYNFMSGFPGESMEDIKQSVDLMNRLKEHNPQCDCGTIKMLLPYPGTKLFKLVQRDYGFEPPQTIEYWSHYNWGEADRLDLTWVDQKQRRFLVRLYFLSLMMNPSYLFVRSTLFRWITRLCYPITRLRFRKLWVNSAIIPRVLRFINSRL